MSFKDRAHHARYRKISCRAFLSIFAVSDNVLAFIPHLRVI